MEIALALALAVAVFLLVSSLTSRGIERARAQRFAEELHALRRASRPQGVDRDETTVGSSRSSSSIRILAPAVDFEGLRAAVEEARRPLEEARRAFEMPEPSSVAAADPAAAARQAADTALVALDAAREALVGLVKKAGARPPLSPAVPLPASPSEATSSPDTIAAARAGAAALADDLRRLRSDLTSRQRTSDRLLTASRLAGDSVDAAERHAEALLPFASILSGLADRVNLLAMSLAVRASAEPAAAGPLGEAAAELRGLFEETRNLTREISSVAPRAAESSRRAREAIDEATSAAEVERGGRDRSAALATQAEAAAEALASPLGETEKALRRAEDGAHAMKAALARAREMDASLRAALEEERRALAGFREEAEAAVAAVDALAAEARAVRDASPASRSPQQARTGSERLTAAAARLSEAEEAHAALARELARLAGGDAS